MNTQGKTGAGFVAIGQLADERDGRQSVPEEVVYCIDYLNRRI